MQKVKNIVTISAALKYSKMQVSVNFALASNNSNNSFIAVAIIDTIIRTFKVVFMVFDV